MKKFSYSSMNPFHFSGELFYEKYKDAEFLKDVRNVQNILYKQDELNSFVNDLKPGESFEVDGMFLKPGSPLIITKSDRVDEQEVDFDAFTARRLSGLTATYVYVNASKFPDICASDAEDLGISWSNDDLDQQCTYLSAVSGAEYFVEYFYCGPLICSLRKYQLNQINDKMLVDILKVRNKAGERISRNFMKSSREPLSTLGNKIVTLGDTFDVREAIKTLPEQIRCFLDYQPKMLK